MNVPCDPDEKSYDAKVLYHPQEEHSVIRPGSIDDAATDDYDDGQVNGWVMMYLVVVAVVEEKGVWGRVGG